MESLKAFFKQFKKAFLIGLTAIAGLLLTLAGLNLIQLSASLILYAGIILLVVAVLSYFLT